MSTGSTLWRQQTIGLKFYGCVRIITEQSTRDASVRAYDVVIIDPVSFAYSVCTSGQEALSKWMACLSVRPYGESVRGMFVSIIARMTSVPMEHRASDLSAPIESSQLLGRQGGVKHCWHGGADINQTLRACCAGIQLPSRQIS